MAGHETPDDGPDTDPADEQRPSSPPAWGERPGFPRLAPWSAPPPPYDTAGQDEDDPSSADPWRIPPQPLWNPAVEPPPTGAPETYYTPPEEPPPPHPPGHDRPPATAFDLPPSATAPRSTPRPPSPPRSQARPGGSPATVFDEPWLRETPSRGGRLRPRPILVAAASLVVVAVLVAGGIVVLGKKGDEKPATPVAQLAGNLFPADPGAKTDGLDQELLSVAASGSTVVAIGGEFSTDYRAEFFVSTDGGRSFRLADVHTPDGQEPPYGDVPRQVAGTAGSWVALGTSPSGAVVWTSRDGTSWTRQPDEAGSSFNRPDRVGRIVSTSSGFVAVGDTSATGDYSDASPLVWLSPDGRHWTRRPADQLGVSAKEGALSLIDAAAVGNTVLAHGWNNTGKSHPADMTWRSTDGGHTWEAVSVPRPKDSSGLGITATPSAFIAARNVAGAKRFSGTVLSSPDARRWTQVGTIQAPGYAGVQRLAGSDRGLAALVDTGKGLAVVRSTDGRTWNATGTIPAARGRTVLALAVTAGATIAVGRDTTENGNDAVLQERDAQGRAVPVDLSRVPGGEQSDRSITALTSGRGLTVAVGSVNGDGAIWTSRDGRGWTRAGAAGEVLARPGRQRLLSAAQGPAGWLAVGYHGLTPKRALVVTSADGTTWQAVDGDGAFKPSGGDPSLTSATAAGPGGYAVVGADGPSAATWYSADLKSWHRGGGADRTDLTGKPGAPRWMADVAGGPFGYVAAGGLKDPTAGTATNGRPAVWTSPDGKVWRLQQLPLPGGTLEATFAHVAARGDQLLAAGTARTTSGSTVFAYTSADGGRSWQQVRLPGDDAAGGMALTALTATPKGFVVAAGGGRGGSSDVYLWTSADGRAWAREKPLGRGLSGRGDQWLTGLTAIGTDLVAVGVTAGHQGEQPTLWRRPLP